MAFTGLRQRGKIVSQGAETTDGSTVTAGLVTIGSNCTGTLQVRLTGKDTVSGEIVYGVKAIPFKRVSGTLSIPLSIVDLIVTTIDGVNMIGATWTVDASGDDLRVRVTGVAGRTIHWYPEGEYILV